MARYDPAEDAAYAVGVSLTVSRRLRGSLYSPGTRSMLSPQGGHWWSIGFRAVGLANEHEGNGSRRYIRALLPLLVVRSTVTRSPKQEQGYASPLQTCCDKAAHKAGEMLL